jgi:hypothetical protein
MAQDRSSGDSADNPTVRVDIGKRRYAAIGRYVEVSRPRAFGLEGREGTAPCASLRPMRGQHLLGMVLQCQARGVRW